MYEVKIWNTEKKLMTSSAQRLHVTSVSDGIVTNLLIFPLHSAVFSRLLVMRRVRNATVYYDVIGVDDDLEPSGSRAALWVLPSAADVSGHHEHAVDDPGQHGHGGLGHEDGHFHLFARQLVVAGRAVVREVPVSAVYDVIKEADDANCWGYDVNQEENSQFGQYLLDFVALMLVRRCVRLFCIILTLKTTLF